MKTKTNGKYSLRSIVLNGYTLYTIWDEEEGNNLFDFYSHDDKWNGKGNAKKEALKKWGEITK